MKYILDNIFEVILKYLLYFIILFKKQFEPIRIVKFCTLQIKYNLFYRLLDTILQECQ